MLTLTDATIIVVHHEARIVEVHDGGDTPTATVPFTSYRVLPCTWLVEGYPPLPDGCDADGWYPDGPGDLIRDCGATGLVFDNGYQCEVGHSHRDNAEYFDDDEIAAAAQSGRLLPANARRINGRPL